MIKIEASTLEEAYKKATVHFDCSLTEIAVEVVQYPSKGLMGLFKKSAIIVASHKAPDLSAALQPEKSVKKSSPVQEKPTEKPYQQKILNDTILPESFVSHQDDEDEYDFQEDEQSYDQIIQEGSIAEVALRVKQEINDLFNKICFDINEIDVQVYDSETLLIEFSGEDAALLIGKEGYRYKALSYMIFNWINSKYELQLRLEIAEFLNNQEEAIARYLSSVHETIDREGRAQTKILDGVLVQIALKQLRETYPDKYVAIRSTRDGLKYIIINDYHNGH
jgi:spoIIIJ-associated protein